MTQQFFLILCLFPYASAFALEFYSIKRDEQQLIRIDATTGDISVIGPLGIGAFGINEIADIDLATVNGRLFAVDTPPGGIAYLYEIDVLTGVVLSSVPITEAGGQVQLAEGLASINGQLFVGYLGVGQAGGISGRLGKLALDGSISNSVLSTTDFDSLGSTSGSEPLYSSDSGGFGANFFTVNVTTGLVNPIPHNGGGGDVLRVGDIFYSINANERKIELFNFSSNMQENPIDIQGPEIYFGLAIVTLIQVSIDIKPGDDTNTINLCSGGAVSVGILGSPTFDVSNVNTDTLRFADAAVKVVGKKDPRTLCSDVDVNNDGFDDLICHFLTTDIAALDGESIIATVKGELLDGTQFEGADSVKIIKDTCN